jgi:hypothetical protein
MYLWKQWRESRLASLGAFVGLVLLLGLSLLVLRGSDTKPGLQGNLDVFLALIFNLQAVVIGGWAWYLGSIGTGRNLGEGSGSFLLTRPRGRAWFVWNDWGFGIVFQAIVILLANLIVGVLCYRLIVFHGYLPPGAHWSSADGPPALIVLLLLMSFGIILFTGLVYGMTYLSTILLKRSGGVMLSAGILIGYFVFLLIARHLWPALHLPSPILGLFDFHQRSIHGFVQHLWPSILVRLAIVLVPPVAAQRALSRSEI